MEVYRGRLKWEYSTIGKLGYYYSDVAYDMYSMRFAVHSSMAVVVQQ